MKNLNENNLTEQPVLDWLEKMGYEKAFGPDLAPGGAFQERSDYKSVVLEPRLKRSLRRINPDIPEEKLEQVANEIIQYSHQDLELGNKEIFEWLKKGKVVEVKDKNGDPRGEIVKIIDFENWENNEFLVVNQFSIEGANNYVKRPDVVVFINGLPIAIISLKSPSGRETIVDAFAEIQEKYKSKVPRILYYNQVLVVADLTQARHGTISSGWDFFTPWKGIDSENEKHKDKSELELLIKGIFPRERLLDIIQNFIVYEADAEEDASKFTKKMCMYYQYFGVNRAIEKTLKAVRGDKKIGVFWHTQGSGKSLSMVFYTNKVRKLEELKGPTLLFLTDRLDLDQQFFKTFLRAGFTTAKQAESIRGLEDKLKGAGSEVLFTTIQKFNMREPLNTRENIIVIADEAHRSQYAELAGNVRDVLPNASFMGITGTPVEFNNRNTRIVFGEHVTEYRINQSVEDGTTVPIYYEGRLIPLHLLEDYLDVDDEYDALLEEHPVDMKEELKKKWARLEAAVAAEDRLQKVAEDIVSHFNERRVEGKAMIVTMSRRIAARMYEIISKMENAPEVAAVFSSNEEYKDRIQKELDNKELEKRFKNPNDPLKIVIVCDMWLTGFDVPHLHTMYLDKPLKGHGLMQAIARVNRRFKDKDGGLVVDYIGVADNLKKALAIYASDIQREAMIPIDDIIEKMMEVYGEVSAFFVGIDYKNWKKMAPGDLGSLFPKAMNAVLSDPENGELDESRKKNFLKLSRRLYKLFSLAMPHKEANNIREEIIFFEAVRKSIIKNTVTDGPGIYIDPRTEEAIRKLLANSIGAEKAIDIFAQEGKAKPDISIFDERFIEEVKNYRFKNLTIEALRRILNDEISSRMKGNIIRYRSLFEMLEEIIEQYENNIINSAKVIEKLIEIAKEIKKVELAAKDLGLSDEELAFYDSLSEGKKSLKDEELKKLVKEIVSTLRRDVSIDWTNHDVIKAKIRQNVRLILLKSDLRYEEIDTMVNRIYLQAEELYRDYPIN